MPCRDGGGEQDSHEVVGHELGSGGHHGALLDSNSPVEGALWAAKAPAASGWTAHRTGICRSMEGKNNGECSLSCAVLEPIERITCVPACIMPHAGSGGQWHDRCDILITSKISGHSVTDHWWTYERP